MINVLIVDDSPTARELLAHVLTSDPQVRVAGFAANGLEAVRAVAGIAPDIITMDLHMPKMDGLEATRRIMAENPKPIVIVSASAQVKDVAFSFKATEAGALAVVHRPRGPSHPEYEASVRELLQTVKLMSEVKVVSRKPCTRKPIETQMAAQTASSRKTIKIAAIGSSTGGPPVLQCILSALPRSLSFPICIVQHIARGFTEGFVEWLKSTTGFPLHIAAHRELLRPGHAYLAPDDFHMGVKNGLQAVLSSEPPENGLRPSISHLFHSVAQAYGPNAAGVLLTGMGNDGAYDLKLMRDRGAVTVAQDKDSSVIHGMPGAAIELGAAAHVLPPEGIATLLTQLGE